MKNGNFFKLRVSEIHAKQFHDNQRVGYHLLVKEVCNRAVTYNLALAKGGIMSEDIGGFLLLPKNIPKVYLKLS